MTSLKRVSRNPRYRYAKKYIPPPQFGGYAAELRRGEKVAGLPKPGAAVTRSKLAPLPQAICFRHFVAGRWLTSHFHQRFVADVFAAPGAWPADLFDASICLQLGVADRAADCGDAEDPAAVG